MSIRIKSRLFQTVALCSTISLSGIGCSNNPVSYENISDAPEISAAANISEYEPNNSYTQANTMYDGYNAGGKIGYANDIDYYKVTFSKSGKVNFYLSGVPYGCDYDIYVYSSNGTSFLISSTNSSNANELISAYSVSASTYYIKVVGYGGCYNSSSSYSLRVKNYVPVAPNGFTSNWSKYKSYFNSVASSYGIDPYVLAAYSANECNMNVNQFTPYPGTGTYTHPITKKVYSKVKIIDGVVHAAMGLTSVQSQYHSEYKANSYKLLYDIQTNLKIGAAEFSTYKNYSVHDQVGYVHLPSDKSAIDRMYNYASTGKTYWQVFVDNYNNIKGQDGISTGLLSY